MVTDQPKGENVSGPHDNEEKCLKIQLRNTSILDETKMEIMQCAVAKCLKVCISTHGIQIPSLLDSGSEVTLLWQSYFDQHILPKIKPAPGEKVTDDTHCLFKLTAANDGQMPIKMYTELDLTFLGLKVPILCCSPNCAFFTIPTYGRPIHWEQYQKSCPRTLKLVSPQRQMTCLKKKH